MSVAEAAQTTARAPSSSGFVLQRKCACGGSAGFSEECEACKRKKLIGRPLQRKLTINEPGDEYEREADRVAEQVMSMQETESCRGKAPGAPLVQRRLNGSCAGVDVASPIVHEVLSSPGQPLDAATRAFFEPRFGHNFGHVRIHLDSMAAASARAVKALAYTQGAHIVFGSGQYAPLAMHGRQLMAHELAHVVQQDRVLSWRTEHGLMDGSTRNVPERDTSKDRPWNLPYTQLTATVPRAVDKPNGKGDRSVSHQQTQPVIQRSGLAVLASSVTGFLGIDTSEIAAQATNPINGILAVKQLFSMPLIGEAFRQAVADRLNGGVLQALAIDNETLQQLQDVFENRDTYFEQLRQYLEPYADSMTQVALAEANARLARLKALGEPFERVIDAMGDQLAMFPSQWWTILRQILVDQFVLWNWTTESQEIANLGQQLGDNIIDSTEYAIGVVRTVLGGVDRVLGAIGLAAFIVGFVGGAATGAGLGGAGAGVVGGVATAGTAAAPSAAVGSGAVGTAGGGIGGGAGAGLFALLGGVSLVGTIAVEAAAVANSVKELTTGNVSGDQEERQYQQIASSILTLSMMAAFALLGAIAGRFAKKMGARLVQAVRNRRVQTTGTPAEPKLPTTGGPPASPPDDVDIGTPTGVHPDSPRLRQLIARLDDLMLRSDSRYRGAIESLRDRVTHLMTDTQADELLDPIRIDELVQRVEALHEFVGQEITLPSSSAPIVGQVMLPGGKVPIIPSRHSLRAIKFGPVEGTDIPTTGLPHRVAAADEVAIPTLALPRKVGMHAPREFHGDARAVTRRVLGDPPDVAAAFERVPQIPYDRTIDDPLRGQLYSHVAQGSSARVYLMTLRVEGRHRMVAVKHWHPGTDKNYIQEEVLKATILGDLGVGPKVFGVVEIEGRPGLAMESVAGDFPEAMPPGHQAIWDLEIAQARMAEAGIAIGDFQYFVTPDGRAVIIDAGGAVFESDPQFTSFSTGMPERITREGEKLEAPAAGPDLREHLGSQLEDPNRLRERARTSIEGEFDQLLKNPTPGEFSAEGVKFSGVRVGQTDNIFWATYSNILNESEILERGRLMHLAFEQATIAAARKAGAASAEVRVDLVVNQKWQAHLLRQGYAARAITEPGKLGFKRSLTKRFTF